MSKTMRMIDNSIFVTVKPNDRETPDDGSSESSVPIDNSQFRKIEFHLARKPFTAFTNGGAAGCFRLERLNHTSTSLNDSHNDQHRVAFDPVSDGSSGRKRDASELGPEISFGITFRRIGAGLENLGNTCFLNSVLQCLTYTEPLAAYLQSGKHQITCRNAGFCALCAIQNHVSRALQSSGKSLAPKDLVSNLQCISQTFRRSRQEDAHEYMVSLLESMHKCCLPSGVPSESPCAYERSLVHNIFGGRLRSQVKCMQCNYCSNKFDPFLDLSLEILKADTLYKAFADFTAKEQLDGGAKQYNCQQCKQKVKALKQLKIHEAPNVLTIHLKRFGSLMSGQKIDKKVHFAPTLDLKPFVTGPYDGDLKYTLYGVLVHAGWSMHSGHYYCFVRTSSGMWYSLDDNQVIQVSERKVFEQKAYMLFYFRDRKNFSSKKPAHVVHHKETVMNSMERNSTSPIISEGKIGNTNGRLESSAQKVISESRLESSLVVLQQNDMVNVPSVLHETTKSDISVEKGHDIDDTIKVDSTSLGNVATVPSTSDGPQKLSPMNDKKEAFSTKLQEHKDRRSTSEDLSDSIAVTICSKPQTSPGDTACVAEEDVALGESYGANGGGGESLKGAVTSMVSSSLPKMETFSIEEKVLGWKRHKKIKKYLKIKVTSMKFCLNILVGASLNQRKKKKHKQKKRSKVPIKNHHVKGTKSGSKIEDKTSHILVNWVENKFEERVYGGGAVLGTSVERNSNGVSGGCPSEVRGPESSNNCTSLQHKKNWSICSLQVSEDRTVPHWYEDESTPSQIRETCDVPSIGYVGDEWDVEYDQGKRKKPRRSCTKFDGMNPFQDIANERLNSHVTKPKTPLKKHRKQVEKSSSASRPFRI